MTSLLLFAIVGTVELSDPPSLEVVDGESFLRVYRRESEYWRGGTPRQIAGEWTNWGNDDATPIGKFAFRCRRNGALWRTDRSLLMDMKRSSRGTSATDLVDPESSVIYLVRGVESKVYSLQSVRAAAPANETGRAMDHLPLRCPYALQDLDVIDCLLQPDGDEVIAPNQLVVTIDAVKGCEVAAQGRKYRTVARFLPRMRWALSFASGGTSPNGAAMVVVNNTYSDGARGPELTSHEHFSLSAGGKRHSRGALSKVVSESPDCEPEQFTLAAFGIVGSSTALRNPTLPVLPSDSPWYRSPRLLLIPGALAVAYVVRKRLKAGRA